MRIAFMHRQLAGGGTEADLRRMATELAGRGHDVHVFCARANAPLPAVTVHRVPIVRAGRAARTLSFALLAPRYVERQAFDVVVGFGRTVRQDLARIGGGTHRSYLATMAATGRRGRGWGPYHRAILWIERRQFGPAGQRRVLAVAARVRDEIVRDYAVPGASIRVVYNGVDGERFRPGRRVEIGAPVRAAFGCGADETLCVGIGSGFERKGFDLLLRLFADDPPPGMRLALVGNDERLAAYRRRARADRIVVAGPRDDVEAVLAAADVVCVPSRQEAFGNVVLEACAAGVPVVTSGRVGAAELLEGRLRDLVITDPEEPRMLRAALVRAVGPEHAELAAAGRQLAEARPWSRHVDELEDVLAEAARRA